MLCKITLYKSNSSKFTSGSHFEKTEEMNVNFFFFTTSSNTLPPDLVVVVDKCRT